MKLRILLLWILGSSLWAASATQFTESLVNTARCDIEIINSSTLYDTVYGTYDTGVRLEPFIIMPDNSSHLISMFYNGYCHPNMYLEIIDANGLRVYAKYASTNTLIRIIN